MAGRTRKAKVTVARVWGIGDASPERLRHAQAAGVSLQLEAERFEDGRPTGLQRKRFVSRLESLHAHGAISEDAYRAAEIYRAHVDMRERLGPRACGRYEPRETDAFAGDGLLPVERAMEYAKLVKDVWAYMPHWLRPVLLWIEQSSNTEIPYAQLAAGYFPQFCKAAQEQKFWVLIEATCATIAEIYERRGAKRLDHAWAQLAISRVAREVARLQRA